MIRIEIPALKTAVLWYNDPMKKQLACIIVALAVTSLTSLTAHAETSYLFIGTSQTNAHGLPGLFAGLAEAGGHAVYVNESVVGGASLSYHSHYQPTLDLIHERDWDHVILQEHTLVPVIEYLRETMFYPAAAELDSIITASGSHTTLFLHWAYPRPEGIYCALDHCSREFEDYFDMQTEMSSAYYPLALELGVPLVQVGDVFASALRSEPTLPLFGTDPIHPAYDGSYLAACVFYATLFGESPIGLDFTGDLDAATALHYQEIAATVTGVEDVAFAGSVRLLSNHPNPFNPVTEISFELLGPARVDLAVFDAAGRRVRDLVAGRSLSAGRHRFRWDGRSDTGRFVAAGVYLYRVDAGGSIRSRSMTLVK